MSPAACYKDAAKDKVSSYMRNNMWSNWAEAHSQAGILEALAADAGGSRAFGAFSVVRWWRVERSRGTASIRTRRMWWLSPRLRLLS